MSYAEHVDQGPLTERSVPTNLETGASTLEEQYKQAIESLRSHGKPVLAEVMEMKYGSDIRKAVQVSSGRHLVRRLGKLDDYDILAEAQMAVSVINRCAENPTFVKQFLEEEANAYRHRLEDAQVPWKDIGSPKRDELRRNTLNDVELFRKQLISGNYYSAIREYNTINQATLEFEAAVKP